MKIFVSYIAVRIYSRKLFELIVTTKILPNDDFYISLDNEKKYVYPEYLKMRCLEDLNNFRLCKIKDSVIFLAFDDLVFFENLVVKYEKNDFEFIGVELRGIEFHEYKLIFFGSALYINSMRFINKFLMDTSNLNIEYIEVKDIQENYRNYLKR